MTSPFPPRLRAQAPSLTLTLALALAPMTAPAATPAGGPVDASAPAGRSLYLEALTSTELQARIAAGTHTVLLPVGGTEQSGPHLVLGKHNLRAQVLAGRIAAGLGHAVVAPTLAYVPEGRVQPPEGHMRFAGTISVPEPAFEALLEGAARSLQQHGLVNVVLIGDHGGYQKSLQRVAAKLDAPAKGAPRAGRVIALTTYYDAAQAPYLAWLAQHGVNAAEAGTHAGLADTALSLATDPALVRPEVLAAGKDLDVAHGVHGQPRRATADLGQAGLDLVVTQSITALKNLLDPAAQASK